MTDSDKQELDDQVKANKSMAEQNIDLQEEINDLKMQLVKTEARLMSTINIINNVMKASESEVNRVHKQLQKNISTLTDWVGEPLSQLIQGQIEQNIKLSYERQKDLSDQFRLAEGLTPLIPKREREKEDKIKEDNKKK